MIPLELLKEVGVNDLTGITADNLSQIEELVQGFRPRNGVRNKIFAAVLQFRVTWPANKQIVPGQSGMQGPAAAGRA